MALFLAVDAGGTKTDYVLADETREIARSRGGTIKLLRTTPDQAAVHLDAALAELTGQSGLSLRTVSRTCLGTAGESVPMIVGWLREAFRARVAGELTIVGDVEIALDAAFQGGPGVLALAGTGSNVAGRMRDGTLTSAGGWGPVLAEQGSGYQIGRRALRAAFLARDEGRATSLLGEVLEFWKLASVEHLVEFANGTPNPDFSALTEVVVRCAREGDAVAGRVLEREGRELARLVRTVLRRVQKSGGDEPGEAKPRLAFAGSILENVPEVRSALVRSVRREFPALEALEGVVDPIQGALWRARCDASC